MHEHCLVKAPATSSNQGSGFDVLGACLDWFVQLEVWRNVQEPSFSVVSEEPSVNQLPGDLGSNLVGVGLDRGFRRASAGSRSLADESLRVEFRSEIPIARGLGSSASALLAGLAAAAYLTSQPSDQEWELPAWVLEEAYDYEGEPGNVAPTVLGGLTFGLRTAPPARQIVARQLVIHSSLDSLHVALFVPDQPLATAESRGCLTSTVERADLVTALARVVLLTQSLASGDTSQLAEACDDQAVHQGARAHLLPWLPDVLLAARQATHGKAGSYLSGAGSSVACLCVNGQYAELAASAMANAAAQLGVPGRPFVKQLGLSGVLVKP